MDAEQKAKRKIGGTLISAVLGKSRWKSRLDAYLELRGELPEAEGTEEQNDDIDRGVFLEPGLREWASKKLGTQFIVPPEKTLALPEWEWATYSPDGLEMNGPRLLELKTHRSGAAVVGEWGDEGTDQVPTEYYLQGAWGCMVTNREKCVFGAFIGGRLRLFEYVRDLELERDYLLPAAQRFVRDHVLAGVPPEPVYSDEEHIKRRWPKVHRKRLAWNDLGETNRRIVADYLRLRALTDQSEKQLKSWEVLIKDMIGDAEGIIGLPPELGFQRIDWKETEAERVKWKGLAEELLIGFSATDAEALKQKYASSEPSRRFTVWALSKRQKEHLK